MSFEVPEEYSRFVCRVIVIPVEEEKPKCDFSRFVGKIKWKGGDPVAYQRSLRDGCSVRRRSKRSVNLKVI